LGFEELGAKVRQLLKLENPRGKGDIIFHQLSSNFIFSIM